MADSTKLENQSLRKSLVTSPLKKLKLSPCGSSNFDTVSLYDYLSEQSCTENCKSKNENVEVSSNNDSPTNVSHDQTKDKDRRIRPNSYKAYHRQIEKKRRNRINMMLEEISSLVPICQSIPHRLDKLSVLELAVQRVEMLTQTLSKQTDATYKPDALTEGEMKYLLEQKQNGFLIVISCDKGKVLHVSDAVCGLIMHTPDELVGHSLLDLVDPKDVDVVQNMLLPNNSLPGNRLSDSPTLNCRSTKRSFCFRLKPSKLNIISSSTVFNIPVSCNGFLKSWKTNMSKTSASSNEKVSTFSCFVGVAVPLTANTKRYTATPDQYSSRHTADATYLYVDPRVFPVSGYLPQELVGNSEYRFVHKDDIQALSETYRLAIQNKHQERVVSDIYRFKLKHGGLLHMRTVAFSLFNPFTKELEFVSHQNFVMGRELKGRSECTKAVPNDLDRLSSLELQCTAMGQIHDEAESKSSRDVENNTIITPLTLNVLRNSGVDTDLLTKLLQRTEVKEDSCESSRQSLPFCSSKQNNIGGYDANHHSFKRQECAVASINSKGLLKRSKGTDASDTFSSGYASS